MHKVLEFVSTVHDLCAVLGIDFFATVTEVHPSLNDATGVQSKSISNDTLSKLAKMVLALKEDKKQRLHKVNLIFWTYYYNGEFGVLSSLNTSSKCIFIFLKHYSFKWFKLKYLCAFLIKILFVDLHL